MSFPFLVDKRFWKNAQFDYAHWTISLTTGIQMEAPRLRRPALVSAKDNAAGYSFRTRSSKRNFLFLLCVEGINTCAIVPHANSLDTTARPLKKKEKQAKERKQIKIRVLPIFGHVQFLSDLLSPQ